MGHDIDAPTAFPGRIAGRGGIVLVGVAIGNAGIGAEQIDLAVSVAGLFDQILDIRLDRDVTGHGKAANL